MNNNSIKPPESPVKKRFFISIRSKMLLFFGLAFTNILVIYTLATIYGIPFTRFGGAYEQHQSAVLKNLSTIADMKKERLVRWLEERRDDTRVLSRSRTIKTHIESLMSVIEVFTSIGVMGNELQVELQKTKPYQSISHHIKLVRSTYGVYDKIQIADAQSGVIIASTHDEDLDMNISVHNVFSGIFIPGYDESMEFLKDPLTDTLELDIVHNIFLDNNDIKPLAILIMHTNTDDFIQPLLHIGEDMGQTGEALLVNQDAIILAPLKHPLADGTTAIPLEYQITAKPAVLASQGEEGIITAEDYRGEKVLAAYRYIRITSGSGWGLIVKKDEAEVFAPLRESIYYSFITGIVCLSLALVLITIIARNLARPIRRLSKVAYEVSEGNLNAHVQSTTSDEVGILSDSFNTMINSLKHAQEKLIRKEKFATIGRISGAIAHDIRHPLATIKNSIYFLNMTLKDSGGKTKKHLKLIDSEINRANEIITGLMRLSEFKKTEMIKTGINEYVKSFFLEFPLPERIKLTFELDNECHDIIVDRLQLRQVFANIASNAVHAMSEAGTLTVMTRRVRSEERKGSELIGDFVEISFADTGKGMKKEVLEKIFEPFYTTKSSGMGLGMSIVKDIVELNGGKITVESEEDKGSTFKVVFPGVRD